MSGELRLANEAWEALFRAQVLLIRRFAADDVWVEVTQVEYDVLYTLSKSPWGMSMVDLNRDVLLSQGGVSRLIARLEKRDLIVREPDPRDGRATLLRLTEMGREIQRTVGRRHASSVGAAMTRVLDADQLVLLRDLATKVVSAHRPGRPGAT